MYSILCPSAVMSYCSV